MSGELEEDLAIVKFIADNKEFISLIGGDDLKKRQELGEKTLRMHGQDFSYRVCYCGKIYEIQVQYPVIL